MGILMIVAVMPAALSVAQHPPREGTPVVVIAAPWSSAETLAVAVGGQMVAPGRIGVVGLVWSPNPAFIDMLYEAGALMVLDGDLSGVLCVT